MQNIRSFLQASAKKRCTKAKKFIEKKISLYASEPAPKIHLYKADPLATAKEVYDFFSPVVLFVVDTFQETLHPTPEFNILVVLSKDLKSNDTAKSIFHHASSFSRVMILSSKIIEDEDIANNLRFSRTLFEHIIFADCNNNNKDAMLIQFGEY